MSTLSIAPSFAPRPAVRTVPAQRRSPAPAVPTRRQPVPQPVPQPAPVRLTRRGRIVITLVLLAVVLAVLTLFSGHSAASGEAGDVVPTRSVVVGEGDTLWGIAAEVADPGEIRSVVHEIEKLNSLPGPALVEGQTLAVPVG